MKLKDIIFEINIDLLEENLKLKKRIHELETTIKINKEIRKISKRLKGIKL